ncbi:hypothetical protein QVD17_28563 [Tagetes erecta]|uniref:MULE transposase domain-containing protein n=1 Tax=Tagetes erecta TaxID=13708 RepID=A0AAD8KE24_TARER|nr:hypothetical protein QVD17_28563 [Tagetes erecta]
MRRRLLRSRCWGNPDTFTLKFYHGGKFTMPPGRKYVKGWVSYVDMVDRDVFSMHEVNDMIGYFGYLAKDMLFINFRVPNLDLDHGLRALGNDHDVLDLFSYVAEHKTIEVYVEQGYRSLDTYEKSPFEKPKIVIEEINDIGTSNPTKSSQICRKPLAIQWLNEELNDGLYEGLNEGFNDNEASELDVDEESTHENEDDSDDGLEESDDEDFFLNEEDKIVDYEVDMEEFRAAVDVNIEDNNSLSDGDLLDFDLDLDDYDSLSEDDEPPLKKAVRKHRRQRRKGKDKVAEQFYVGHQFFNKAEIRVLVKKFATDSRRQLKIIKNDNKRFRVVCNGIKPVLESDAHLSNGKSNASGSQKQVDESNKKCTKPRKKNLMPTCPFKLHITNHNKLSCWVVKTFMKYHSCLQTRDVNLCTVSFLAREIEDIVSVNPSISIVALRELINKKYQINVSTMKVFRAKTMATHKIEGDYRVQYEILRDYCDEVLRSNPGSTVKLDVETEPSPTKSTRQFRRIYICLGALKAGFKLCGRCILGLDGCFMKGPYPGQILSAVGLDSNNGIYPVAYALVEAETQVSWTWFLEILGNDLDLYSNTNFTFISDRQKGLLPALEKVFPGAEHRFCLRHIMENMKPRCRGDLFKILVWNCAAATTVTHFKRAMKEVEKEDQGLLEWLRNIQPNHWTRSHFSCVARSDVLLNNLCEAFNKQLVGGRDKPIITCLEFIREYLMRRIVTVHKIIADSEGPLTPKIQKLFEVIKTDASQYTTQFNGKMIWNMEQHGQDEGIPENWVSDVYWLSTWKKVYDHTVEPITGMDFWTPSQCPTTIDPPKHHKPIGRPKKQRKKSNEELAEVGKDGKMSRRGNTVTCDLCKNKGHNKRSCKGQGGTNASTSKTATKASTSKTVTKESISKTATMAATTMAAATKAVATKAVATKAAKVATVASASQPTAGAKKRKRNVIASQPATCKKVP